MYRCKCICESTPHAHTTVYIEYVAAAVCVDASRISKDEKRWNERIKKRTSYEGGVF